MPDAVKWLLPIVVGESWPEGDETKLRALRDAWHAASSAIAPVVDTGNQASKEILANWTGDAAQAYAEQWKKFVDGDEAFFKQLTDATKALGDSCDQTALDVEYTKYMIIISLVILAAQIIAMIAAAAVTFGGSTAGIAPAQIATRMTVQMLFRQLLEKLAQQGFKQVAKELLEKLLKQGLKKIGMEILKNEAMNLGMDAGIQGLQMAKGDRKDWDWAKTKDSAISGAVGGVVGAASGSIGKGATGALSHSAGGQVLDSALRAGARGAVEGVAQTVGQAAVTGKLGELTPEQLLMGASSGAVGGAVGGAKEQLNAIHEANIPHTEPDGGTHEPSSHDDDSSPEPESRREAEPESRSEAEPESRSEPETRQESAPSSERQTSEHQESAPQHESQQRQESAPEPSRAPEHQEVAPRHAAEAPESAPQRAPEPTPDAAPHRAESGPAPSSDHAPAPERPAADHAPAPERPAADHAPAPERPSPAAAPEPEHRAAPQQPDAPAPHQQAPASPQPAGGPAPATSGGSPSHGGYGMAPNSGAPANFGEPRQTGGRVPQENLGVSGFAGGQNVPPHDGGFGPAQPASAPPPPQAPPPGGMPPAAPPPGGMAGGGPRQGGPGPRPGGPVPHQPPPVPPRSGPPNGDPRRTPPPPNPRPRQGPPPPNGGPMPPHDPRRMPPQDPRNRPMPQGGPPQRPPVGPPPPGRGPGAGYPPRPPQGPHPGGRPPGPPQGPPGGRPMPPHDPRFGPRPAGPPQVPGPRHGAPPPEHWQRGPQDRTPPQRPMPHEQPRPVDRAPEQQHRAPAHPPEQVRPPEQPRHEQVPEQPRPEHTPVQEQVPHEQGPHDPDAPRQEHVQEQPAEQHAPHENGLDERHLTDPEYRTTDPAGLRRIEETFIDSGFGRENPDEFRHEEVQRQALAKRDASHPGMSDAGAIAVHGYTRHELFTELNKAMRFGGPELADLTPQARALTSGLNELPPHVGTVSRRIRFDGDPARIDAFLARYSDGAHVVEPAFMSSSKVDATLPRSKFAGEVEMRIESKTGRDIEDLASVRSEREVLFKAGTQLQVTHVEKGPGHPDNDPHGVHRSEPQWIVHAEEIAPGDPRHLGPEESRQAIEERREQERAIEEQNSRSNRIWQMLGQEGPPPEPAHTVVEHTGPATHEPPGGWSELARPLTPGGEPVLHAGSVESPQQHARLLRDLGVEQVNTRNYYARDALENGYRTNAAESLVAFERRMSGEDAIAAPDRDGIGHQQSLDHVGEQLGRSWTTRDNFDGIARELGERPVGARTAVAYEEHVPAKGDTPARVETRMVAAIKTEHGIVFADPRTGRLADLPENAGQIRSMPLGGGDAPHHVAEAPPVETHHAPVDETPAPPKEEPPAPVEPERTITDRLRGDVEAGPVHDEGYLFDREHRATPEDHRSIRDQVGDEGIYDRIHDDALRRRNASETLGHLTDEGAVAIHAYTYDHAYAINEANRSGPGHPGWELAQHNTRAIVDGLNQIQPQSGELLRGIDTKGDPRVADLVAGGYEKGQVAVETTLTSATIKTDGVRNKFGDDVVLHIRSDNIRDISSISQARGEGESISPPATQLLVHDKRLEIGPGGKRTWVIEAEEIGPGHPRYLDREAAERQMAENRARHVETAQEIARLKEKAALSRLDGLVETPPHADLPTEAPPHTEPTPESVHDVPDTTPEPAPAPEHGWSELARATNPPSEPAIHADTASPEQRAAYVRERHPQLAEVNPHFHDPDALARGYRSNCVNGAESYWDRLHGGDMTADPLHVADMQSRGTLEHIEGRFGQKFSERADYDAVIREMREMPVDHHAVVAVKYLNANGVEVGHVAMVVHTREGVAFIDPQSGDLMHLPQPPRGIRLMHVGVPDPAAVHAPAAHTRPADPRIAYADRTQPFVRPEPDVRPSRIGPDGRPVPSVAEHGGYGAAEPHSAVDSFLARDDVAAALDGHAEADYIRQQLAHHPELVRMMAEPGNEYLTRSLLDNPKTIASLLKHPEAIPILEDALHEVSERGYTVIDDVRENGVTSFEPTPEQAEISAQVTEISVNAEPHERGHGSFDHSRMHEPGYAESWVAGERERWPENQGTLNKITERIAGETDGVPGYRPDVKDDVRALAKIRKYQGDGSKLTDLVGTKIQFDRVDNMYRALDALRRDPSLKIVSFDDRIQDPVPSGYRDLQLNVRLENGHVAELRLHLTHIDDVAGYEHALYEVRRDFDTLARKEKRPLSPEEAALEAALTEQVRERFETAFKKGLLPETPEENT